MYKRVLIANRGDCACRLIDGCHRLGIEAVLIASRDEPSSLAVSLADHVCYTGMSRDAYLEQENILDTARETGCEAIVPGWGFLSEDYRFARRVRLSGIDFVGPRIDHMQIFGDKYETLRQLVSVLKTDNAYGLCSEIDDLMGKTPIFEGAWMLKGRYGGGGKSIYRHSSLEEMKSHIESLESACEVQDYYIERAVDDGRHIEIQLFGCGAGGTRALGIRDCTHQKNHQKWLEFSVERDEIAGLGELVQRCEAYFSSIAYEGWGTIEFLVDAKGAFHLLEVNPRLQVEHGVTEMQSGLDLVELGLKWSCLHEALPEIGAKMGGIEFRLYARSSGRLTRMGFDGYVWPEHEFVEDADYRLETGYVEGDWISGIYDGCLARFMVRGETHEDCFSRLKLWLEGFSCEGVETNFCEWNFLKSLKTRC